MPERAIHPKVYKELSGEDTTMQLKPEEISKIIRAQIKHYENVIEQSEVGTVILVGDGIARASGLEKCMAGELLQFENGEYGMAQNLEENTVSIVLLGSDVGIKEGSTVKRTGKVVSVPVGEALIMTAAGLAVAIPAVLAFNVFGRIINRMEGDLEGFARDLRELLVNHSVPQQNK